MTGACCNCPQCWGKTAGTIFNRLYANQSGTGVALSTLHNRSYVESLGLTSHTDFTYKLIAENGYLPTANGSHRHQGWWTDILDLDGYIVRDSSTEDRTDRYGTAARNGTVTTSASTLNTTVMAQFNAFCGEGFNADVVLCDACSAGESSEVGEPCISW